MPTMEVLNACIDDDEDMDALERSIYSLCDEIPDDSGNGCPTDVRYDQLVSDIIDMCGVDDDDAAERQETTDGNDERFTALIDWLQGECSVRVVAATCASASESTLRNVFHSLSFLTCETNDDEDDGPKASDASVVAEAKDLTLDFKMFRKVLKDGSMPTVNPISSFRDDEANDDGETCKAKDGLCHDTSTIRSVPFDDQSVVECVEALIVNVCNLVGTKGARTVGIFDLLALLPGETDDVSTECDEKNLCDQSVRCFLDNAENYGTPCAISSVDDVKETPLDETILDGDIISSSVSLVSHFTDVPTDSLNVCNEMNLKNINTDDDKHETIVDGDKSRAAPLMSALKNDADCETVEMRLENTTTDSTLCVLKPFDGKLELTGTEVPFCKQEKVESVPNGKTALEVINLECPAIQAKAASDLDTDETSEKEECDLDTDETSEKECLLEIEINDEEVQSINEFCMSKYLEKEEQENVQCEVADTKPTEMYFDISSDSDEVVIVDIIPVRQSPKEILLSNSPFKENETIVKTEELGYVKDSTNSTTISKIETLVSHRKSLPDESLLKKPIDSFSTKRYAFPVKASSNCMPTPKIETFVSHRKSPPDETLSRKEKYLFPTKDIETQGYIFPVKASSNCMPTPKTENFVSHRKSPPDESLSRKVKNSFPTKDIETQGYIFPVKASSNSMPPPKTDNFVSHRNSPPDESLSRKVKNSFATKDTRPHTQTRPMIVNSGLESANDMRHIHKETTKQNDLIRDEIPRANARDRFVSDDPAENLDNDDPEWQLTRMLETDDQRYQVVRRKWCNLTIPNPHINLTTHSCRLRRHGRGVKRPLPVDADQNGNGNRKRQRLFSCTRTIELKREQLEQEATKQAEEYNRNFNVQRMNLQERFESSMYDLQGRYSYANRWCMHVQRRTYETQYAEALHQIANEHGHAMNQLNQMYCEKRHALDKSREEIMTFNKFYSRLKNSVYENGDATMVSEETMLANMELDIIYNAYENYYR